MNIGALVALIWVVQLVYRYTSGKKDGTTGARRKTQGIQDWYAFYALLVWVVLGSMALTAAFRTAEGDPRQALVVIACSWLLFPWAWVRCIVIPLGWPRAAYAFTLLAQVRWRGDNRGGRAVAATLALLHRKNVTEEQVEWIDSKLSEQFWRPTKTGGVLARALLASRVDRDDARRLMRSVAWFSPKGGSRLARRLAIEWLACEAAEAGDWTWLAQKELLARDFTALVRFLNGVARRIEGSGPSDASLFVFWLLSRGRWRNWSLLQRARQAKRRLRPKLPKVDGLSPLAAALRLHVALVARPAQQRSTEELVALGLAWEAALADSDLHARVRGNAALALAMNDPLVTMRADVLADLASMIRESSLSLPPLATGGELVRRAASEVREELLSSLELSASRLAQHAKLGQGLPPIDEWRSYVAFRDEWNRAVMQGGQELRRLAFRTMHPPLCTFAVWLFNVRKQKPMANAVFVWLLAEAKAAGDEGAIELQTKNVAIGTF